MDNSVQVINRLDRIDLERFFNTLSGKLEKSKLEVIAAAIAESIAGCGLDRIHEFSTVNQQRLIQLRQLLRWRFS